MFAASEASAATAEARAAVPRVFELSRDDEPQARRTLRDIETADLEMIAPLIAALDSGDSRVRGYDVFLLVQIAPPPTMPSRGSASCPTSTNGGSNGISAARSQR